MELWEYSLHYRGSYRILGLGGGTMKYVVDTVGVL